jgi:hypothetical protein
MCYPVKDEGFRMEEQDELPADKARKAEHKRMVGILWRDKSIFASALNLDAGKLWFRGKEFVFNNATNEKADMVFQDRWDAYRGDEGATCFVVELKSDQVDHEVLGQLKKAVDAMDRWGKSTKHWDRTVGVAVGKRFTASGLELLASGPYFCFEWVEVGERVSLVPTGPLFAPLCGVVKKEEIVRKARRKGGPVRWSDA